MGDIRLKHRTSPVFPRPPVAAKAPVSAYQPPRRPEPPQLVWVPPPPAPIEKSPLSQFVILSILLHAIFILLFGAPSGGSREGRAMWGSMHVLLTGPVREPEPILKLDRAPIVPVAPVRPEPVEALALDPSVAREIARTAAPAARPEKPYSIPKLLDRIVTPEPKLQMSPTLVLPLPKEEAPQPPPAPVVEPVPIEVPAPLVAQPPVVLPAPLETPALPALTSTPPVARPPIELPALPVPTETITPMSPTQVREFDRSEPVLPPIRVEPAPAVRPEPPPAVRTEPTPALRTEPPAAVRTEPAEGRPSPFKSPAPSTDARSYDPTAPSLDLDAVRRRAGELTRQGTGNRALLPFPMPAVPERKSKMETAIENARKPDCRTAYQSLGLAAIVPLIANEFGEGSCRW